MIIAPPAEAKLLRIVRMHFSEEGLPQFLDYFKTIHAKVQNQPGCYAVYLLADADHPLVWYTYSYWDGVGSLNTYRDSELFEGVWTKTKTYFGGRPQAFSLVLG